MTTPLADIFVNDIPLIDVRAESEFENGAFPTARNLPILNDEERRLVGISYKEEGAEVAEALGHRLVSGATREARIKAWTAFIDDHPDACLYCFRGGQRSAIAAEWLAEAGYNIERIPGGYKAMRRYLLQQFENPPSLVIISGQTGVGKTELLAQLENTIDLEARARHRGSAFGSQIEAQPAQIDFENSVAIDMLKADPDTPVYLEDESRLIGKVSLPPPLFERMKGAPVILLEDELANRVDRIHQEYILERWQAYRRMTDNDDEAHEYLTNYLRGALDSIQKRLGGAKHKKLKEILEDASSAQRKGEFDIHKQWIERLLTDYYDPMYNYQLDKKRERIIFAGTRDEILERVGYDATLHARL